MQNVFTDKFIGNDPVDPILILAQTFENEKKKSDQKTMLRSTNILNPCREKKKI